MLLPVLLPVASFQSCLRRGETYERPKDPRELRDGIRTTLQGRKIRTTIDARPKDPRDPFGRSMEPLHAFAKRKTCDETLR
jgi:hypothetical protein